MSLTSSAKRDQEFKVRLGGSFREDLIGRDDIHQDRLLAHNMLATVSFPALQTIANPSLAELPGPGQERGRLGERG